MYRRSVKYAGAMALSAGGAMAATCTVVKPEYDVPSIPTDPLDQSCSASQAMASYESWVSSLMYSSIETPPELPVPRLLTYAKQYPRCA